MAKEVKIGGGWKEKLEEEFGKEYFKDKSVRNFFAGTSFVV
ncbi:MAG: hypothetical protein AAB605_02220 [Patescibacteria group bacterium]